MQNEWVNMKATICKFLNTAFGKYAPQSSVCFHSPADLMEKYIYTPKENYQNYN